MRLTRRGEYAVRAMLELAWSSDGSLVRSHDIAERQDIPPKFLPQIVNDLARAGLIATVRGAAGGVRLARPASGISVAEIVEVAEGPLALNECLLADDVCERKERCPVAPVWGKAQQALLDVLGSTTLEQLAAAHPAPVGGAR